MATERPEAFDGNFVTLIREMEAARRQLDELPDDQDFTQEQLAALDDVRKAALGLSYMAEGVIEDFEGR